MIDCDFILDRMRVDESCCWIWTRYVTAAGYGEFRHQRRRYQAHRVAYELFVGEIPEGLVIDHLCRVRNCVNPQHMEPVTIGENALRGVGWAGQHARKSHCVNGHEFAGQNLYHHPDGRRACRACNRAASMRRLRRLREERSHRID